MRHTRIELETDRAVRSLCWSRDSLIDVVDGLTMYSLDGSRRERSVGFAFPFDAAVLSPSGRFAVIYQRLGTKGAVVEVAPTGKRTRWIVREIDRSFYHATVYDFPVAFLTDHAGRELLVHCPKEYNRLEFEEVESGERLTDRDSESADFFHSRLQTSPDGRYLLSAGWIWHPIDWLGLYDIEQALRDPSSLDQLHDGSCFYGEIASATFLDEHRLLLTGHEEINEPEPDDQGVRWAVAPGHVAVFDLEADERVSHVHVSRPLGEVMAFDDCVVGFWEHPRLYNIQTGELLAEWPDIPTGKQNSSILHHLDPPPPTIAKDAVHRRFAVALPDRVVVISLHESER